jgi:hypothetical protein
VTNQKRDNKHKEKKNEGKNEKRVKLRASTTGAKENKRNYAFCEILNDESLLKTQR